MFKLSREAFVEFLLEEDGPTAVEYCVMLALICGVIVGSVTFLANTTKESFIASGDAIEGAFAN